jgi:GNAT superfamily N-acetyltransferase
VTRGPIVVRDAIPEDAAAILRLWTEAPAGDRNDRQDRHSLSPDPDVGAAVARVAADPTERLLVALLEDEVCGAVHLRRAPITPIHDEDAIHVDHLNVRASLRRKGVGRALIEAGATWAEEKDSHHLLAIVAASSRDGNRFMARLGFSQVAIVRAASVTTVRLKLAGEQIVRGGDRVVAARRSLRRRRMALVRRATR